MASKEFKAEWINRPENGERWFAAQTVKSNALQGMRWWGIFSIVSFLFFFAAASYYWFLEVSVPGSDPQLGMVAVHMGLLLTPLVVMRYHRYWFNKSNTLIRMMIIACNEEYRGMLRGKNTTV